MQPNSCKKKPNKLGHTSKCECIHRIPIDNNNPKRIFKQQNNKQKLQKAFYTLQHKYVKMNKNFRMIISNCFNHAIQFHSVLKMCQTKNGKVLSYARNSENSQNSWNSQNSEISEISESSDMIVYVYLIGIVYNK